MIPYSGCPQFVHRLCITGRATTTHVEIRRAERLSFRERQVVVLKEMGLSNEAVARRLGITAATVATLYSRARSKGYEVVIVLPGESLGIPPEEETAGD